MGLLAKTTRPSSFRIAPRRRLFRLLDRAARSPIVWIAGPAGCGKTSLVSSYVEARRLSALWYQLDAGDGDPAAFFYYMGAALRQSMPRQRRPMPLLTPEYLHDVPTFAQRYFERLIDRLGTAPVVVLDNYQDVPREAALHAILRRGFAAIPEGARVIVASRHMPPPAFARFRTHGQMPVVGWEDLRLTLEESRALARAGGNRTARNADVQTAHVAADGWAAGLIMMLRSAKAAGSERRATGRLTREEIFDYFGSELFDQAEAETQRFLVETALLPGMTARMARELTRLEHAGNILARLSDNHFFTTRDLQPEPVFQYHPLFRDFLLERGRRSRSQTEESALLERAASILEAQGRTEEALALVQESAAWERLATLIVRHAPAALAQGRSQTVEAWTRSLPRETVDADPWLLYWRGLAVMPNDLAECRRDLETAFTRFDAQGEPIGRLLAWSAIVDSHLYAWDDFGPLDRWIAWLDGQTRDATARLPPAAEAPVVTSMSGALVHRQPSHPQIGAWIARTWRVLSDPSEAQHRLRAGTYAFLHYFWLGDFGKAFAVADEILRLARTKDAPPLSRVAWKWCEAAAFTWRDQHSPELAQQSVAEGLALAQASGVHTLDYMLLAQGAVASIAMADLSAAGETIKQMGAVARGRNARAYHHYLASWHAILKRDLQAAVAHAEQALTLAAESGMPFSEALAHLALAELLHEQEHAAGASAHIAEARRLMEPTGSDYFSCAAYLAEARLALHSGGHSSTDALRKALETMRRQRMVNTYFWNPSWMAELCVVALDHGIETTYVRQLVRKRRLRPEAPPLHCPDWPWEVRIACLGTFAVERDDRPLEFPAKAPRKTLLFLKTLIACGERGANSGQIADLLWPDADGDSAQRALDTSLYRLRQLLGNEKAVQLREGWIRLDSRYCWVDALAFDALLARAEGRPPASGGGLTAERRRDIETALTLYRGPFLPEASEPWLASCRERLQRRFVRAIEQVGASYELESRPDQAERWYLTGLEAHETAESLYQRLIRCQAVAGRAADALATYERCRQVLRSSLGVEPSVETDALLADLARGARAADGAPTSVH